MLSMDEIRKKLQDRNLAEVGRRLNVTRSWLQAIRCGKVNCSEDFQRRLSQYLGE